MAHLWWRHTLAASSSICIKAARMPFPMFPRVVFRKNPLHEVICQLRFPPVLRIDREPPAEFQEQIRTQFPDFSESSEFNIDLSVFAPAPIFQEGVAESVKHSAIKNYEFNSEDGQWKVNLTRGYIALTSKSYRTWEEFKEKLAVPLGAVASVYSPPYYTRVGLRYVSIIRRSELGLTNVPWRELLQPHVAGFLAAEEVSDAIKAFNSKYEIGLDDERSLVRITLNFVQAPPDDEICYSIDDDFYTTSRTAPTELSAKLDYYNVRASRLIQWILSERLREAMEPEPR